MEVKPGYKQTEVGVIPEEWEVFQLGELISYTKGFPFKSSEYQSAGIRVVRVSDTTYDSIKADDPIYVSESSASRYGTWQLKEHDLVVSTVGSKPPMYDSMVGKVILIEKSHENTLLNQNAVLIRDKKRRGYFQRLLLNHLRTKRYLLHIEAIYRGNANQASITLKELFQFRIPLPSDDEEQRAIATALSDVDGLLGGLDRLIAKKRDLKQAAMQQLLTGQTRLPGFHGEWSVVELKSLYAKVFKKSPLSSADGRTLGAYPLFVSGGEAKRTDLALFQNTEALIISDGGVFDVKYFSGDFSVTDHCFVICLKGDMRFYFQWMSLRKTDLDLMTFKGSGLRNLDKPTFGKVEVPLPPHPEQTAIAEVLTEMDGELVVLEQRREKTRALKQAMMQELLTGRTRLV
jgi:type I restriction enzyme S subunit